MSSREQGLIPSVCLNEAVTSEPQNGAEPDEKTSTQILDSIKELSKALEEQEERDQQEEEEEDEHGELVCVCVFVLLTLPLVYYTQFFMCLILP